ncbi:hypothetical protein [Nonomuraea recticatena]|uniref:hypothetical protein n=1 Tax=Nonomuraea recticatena TaxID=46178 RepID=UPI003613874B
MRGTAAATRSAGSARTIAAPRASNRRRSSGVNRSASSRWWANSAQKLRTALGMNSGSRSSKTRSKASKKCSCRSSPICVSDPCTPRR